MTMLYTPPQKLFLPSDDYGYQENSNSVSDNKGLINNKNILYKQISPRRKFDKFGIDKTDYKAFALSSTIYPTAVKTTLLADLQLSNPHKCGFDIVERPKLEVSMSLTSKASSIINAPPPTAVQSQRGPGSTQSAPIVSFVEIPSSDMPGTRRTSANSKSTTRTSLPGTVTGTGTGSDVVVTHRDGPLPDDNDDVHRAAAALEARVITELNPQILSMMVRQQQNKDEEEEEEEEGQGGREILARGGSLKFMQQRFQNEKQAKIGMGMGKENHQEEPKVISYSRFDNTRLIRYQWMSRESRTAVEKKDGGDIRDPLYLNTFCADERPVRFKKISLPHLSRASRPRPWTVGEASISNRMALLAANRRSLPASSFADRSHPKYRSNSIPRNSWTANNNHNSTVGLPSVRKSSSVFKVDKNYNNNNSKEDENDDGLEVEEDEDKDEAPILEIRSCLANSSVSDQRDKLKGKDGCLHSRVKQCVRFARYRERWDKQDENRPMKSEGGRYRPFSKTDVRNHDITNPPPTPELKLQQSVETYQKYMESIARQTNMSSPKPFTFRGQSSSSRPTHTSLTMASSATAIDTDSMIVQSVMDSNRPDAIFITRTLAETPRPQNSAIYTKDVSAVGDVLDIKKISPKQSTNRIVPGTRVAHEKIPSSSPRCPSESSDESVDMAEVDPSSAHGNAIVVPMGRKSECPSEYSISKEDLV